MKTKAAVNWGVGQDWKIEELELDDPKHGEVLVKLAASGLCHSDEHIVTGAGDETLRFWNVFPGPKTKGDASDSSSMLEFQGRTAIR